MSISEDFITLNNHSAWTGRTYVPPSTIVHHLDDVNIMAGSPGIGGSAEEGTGPGQGGGPPEGFEPGGRNSAKQRIIWDDESPASE